MLIIFVKLFTIKTAGLAMFFLDDFDNSGRRSFDGAHKLVVVLSA